MPNVYLVSSGSYSDYSIEAVFSTKEKAQEYIDECMKVEGRSAYIDNAEIEEYTIDEPRKHSTHIYITMTKEGNVDNDPYVDHTYGPSRESRFVCFWRSRGGEMDSIRWCVETDDIQRAIKVTNEKRTQILAWDIWGDSDKVSELFG